MTADPLTLSFLGTGGAVSAGRAWTSILVNDRILLEASPTAPLQLLHLNKELPAITHLLLSHFHADHTFGLPLLLCRYAYVSPREVPLQIVGPPGLREYVETLLTTAFPDHAEEILGRVPIRYAPLSPAGGEFHLDGVQGRAFPMAHGRLAAYGYALRLPQGDLGFSGDTAHCPSLKRLLDGVGTAILEMTSLDARIPGHLNRADIEALLKSFPGTLFLVHLGNFFPAAIPPLTRTIVPDDLSEYAVDAESGEWRERHSGPPCPLVSLATSCLARHPGPPCPLGGRIDLPVPPATRDLHVP